MDSGHRQSKQPRSVLAGSYGHPVHPILVTVPIGAWVCALVFDLVSFGSASPRPWAVRCDVADLARSDWRRPRRHLRCA